MGFVDLVVLLTALHFHFAGFSLFGLLGWTASSDSDQNKTEFTMAR